MYQKGSKKRTIRFELDRVNSARTVHVAGDFNHWRKVRMRKRPDGSYVSIVPVPGDGSYEYKFVIDGQWETDPDNNTWAMSPNGMLNSVATVEWPRPEER